MGLRSFSSSSFHGGVNAFVNGATAYNSVKNSWRTPLMVSNALRLLLFFPCIVMMVLTSRSPSSLVLATFVMPSSGSRKSRDKKSHGTRSCAITK